MSSKKLPVAINVFPTFDYLELVKFQEKGGDIEKAAAMPCPFELANRQIEDEEALLNAVRDLYNTNKVPFNTPAVLVLPSFFTREIDLPAEFSKDELRFALVSEAERFYVFKKAEPQVSWINLEETRLLYSAYPKVEIEKYQKVFQELKIPLAGIELSYFSVMRGLVATGTLTEEIDNNGRWCLVVLTDTTFFVSIQEGIRVLKTSDTPLSVSAEDEAANITEIQQDFDTFTETEAFEKLIVVNNSTRINADEVIGRVNYQGPVIIIEQNGLTLQSRGATEGAFPCSLEAIGGVFYQDLPEVPSMNFMSSSAESLADIMHYRQLAFKVLLGVNGAVFVLCLLIWGVLNLMVMMKDQEIQELSKQAASLSAIEDVVAFNEVQRRLFVKKTVDQNIQLNNVLVKLGTYITQDLWLDKITLISGTAGAPTQKITLEGKAVKPEPVNELMNQMTTALNRQDLELRKMDRDNSVEGQSLFAWIIDNQPAGANTDPAAAAGGP